MKNYLKEVKLLFILSIPLIISQFCALGKEMVDTMMVGNIDKYNLAGMALATSIYMLFNWFFVASNGTFIAVFSRLYGSRDFPLLKDHIHQAMYLNIIIGAIATVVLLNIGVVFQFMDLETQTKQIAQDYLSVLGMFCIIVSITCLCRVTLLSFVKNKTILFISILTFLLNIPLNYLFIFKLEMGAVGSSWATIICHFIELSFAVLYICKLKGINVFSNLSKYNLEEIMSLFKISIPVALETLILVGVFSAISFILVSYGEVSVGSHQILFNFYATSFTIVAGLGVTIIQRISFFLGLNEINNVKKVIYNALGLVLFIVVVESTFAILFRNEIASFYTKDPEISKIVISILLLAPIYYLFDNLRGAARSVLMSYHKNKEILMISAPSYWLIALFGGYMLSKFYGVLGFWIAVVMCYGLVSIIQIILVYKLVWLNNEK